MTFLRRLKLYGFGFGIGLLLVYAMFGTRRCTMPNEIKMSELIHQSFDLSGKAACKLKCLRRNLALLKVELKQFEVNYDLSTVRKKPCGEYFIEPQEKFAKDYNFKLVIYDCDTISRIDDIQIITTNTCNCK